MDHRKSVWHILCLLCMQHTTLKHNELRYRGRDNMDYSEKRGFIRIKTDSKIEYRVMGSQETYYGECINLSAGGVLFTSEYNVEPGTLMEISIKPEHAIVSPLDATIKVVRSQSNNSGGYSIAGQIKDLV